MKRIIFVVGVFMLLSMNAVAEVAFPVLAGVPHASNKPKYIEVYGHRGARSYSPENTIPGYKTSLAIGVDWVDMDIGMTKDGVVVVSHDSWLNPDIVSDQQGYFWADSKESFISHAGNNLDSAVQPYLLRHLTFQQLQRYYVGQLNPKSLYRHYFPNQVAVANTRIPTLQSVIDYVNQVSHQEAKFTIEIKTDPTHPQWTVSPKVFANTLYHILRENNLFYRAEIQAFDWRVLYELQKLDTRIKTAYLIAQEDKDRLLNKDPKVAGLWSGGKLLKDYNNSFLYMVKALGGSCYLPEDTALSQADVDEAHKLGLKVVVWSWPERTGKTFDPVMMNRLIQWGVDGIITDDPGRLISMLAARGYRVPPRYLLRT